MPRHHDVRPSDVLVRRLRGTLAAAAARAPVDFAELLMTPGLGARTVEALAAVAELVHGAPCRFTDPARFSLAHGGKDGHPFPVPLRVYDQTIAVMRRAVDAARLGNDERLAAIRRLDAEARRLEAAAAGPTAVTDGPTAISDGPTAVTDGPTAVTDGPTAVTDGPTAVTDGPTFDGYVAAERARSVEYGGRTVFDDFGTRIPKLAGARQLELFAAAPVATLYRSAAAAPTAPPPPRPQAAAPSNRRSTRGSA
jgi:hypothetical protein